jgi:hypothetical protein
MPDSVNRDRPCPAMLSVQAFGALIQGQILIHGPGVGSKNPAFLTRSQVVLATEGPQRILCDKALAHPSPGCWAPLQRR